MNWPRVEAWAAVPALDALAWLIFDREPIGIGGVPPLAQIGRREPQRVAGVEAIIFAADALKRHRLAGVVTLEHAQIERHAARAEGVRNGGGMFTPMQQVQDVGAGLGASGCGATTQDCG